MFCKYHPMTMLPQQPCVTFYQSLYDVQIDQHCSNLVDINSPVPLELSQVKPKKYKKCKLKR